MLVYPPAGTVGPWVDKLLCAQEASIDYVRGLIGTTRAFLVAARLVLPRSKGFESAQWRWVVRVVLWVQRMLIHNGLEFAVQHLKELASSMRAHVFKKPSVKCRFREGLPPCVPWSHKEYKRKLMQWSRFSRGLPAPPEIVAVAALEDHRAVLSSAFTTNSETLRKLDAFCRSLSGDVEVCRRGMSKRILFAAPSTKSCFEAPASAGTHSIITSLVNNFRGVTVTYWEAASIVARLPVGMFGDTVILEGDRFHRENLQKKRLDEWLFHYSKDSEMSLDSWELQRERLFSVAACWLHVNWRCLPMCRAVVVLERGWKTRVVTPEEAAFGYLCSSVNNVLMAFLRIHPLTAASVNDTDFDWSWGKRYSFVRSLDLKAASDYIPFDVAKVAVTSFLEGAGHPAWLIEVAVRAVGAHRVISKDGHEWISRRGSLMGNPVTWPILCLLLMACHKFSGTKGWAQVCGDDYIGCHTLASNRRFTQWVHEFGLVLSEPKDYFTRNGYGIFKEELVIVGRCRVIPSASIRPLTGFPKDDTPLWSMGPTITKGISHLPADEQSIVAAVVALTYKQSYSLLNQNMIRVRGPRWCGGAGFPGLPDARSGRIARGLLSQGPKALGYLLDYARAWSKGADSLAMQHAMDLTSLAVGDTPVIATMVGESMTADELLAECLGRVTFAYRIAGALSPEDSRLSITKVGKRVTRVDRQVAAAAWWVPHDPLRDWVSLGAAALSLEPRFVIYRGSIPNIDFNFALT